MSGQGAKKKRLGSRRNVSRQKETSEADESYVTDGRSAVRHVAGESTEAVDLLSNPDEFRLETKEPVPMNRKKLGSSRRQRGRQQGKDSEIDTCPEVREEVEEHTRGQSTFQTTQMSEAVQLESQMEICQGSEHANAPPLKSSSRSTVCHEYYSEVMKSSPTICPEEAMESLGPKNENKLQSFPNEETKENPHEDGSSQLTSPSVLLYPSEDKQLVNIPPLNSMDMADQGLSHFYSVEEIESNKSGYTGLITESGGLQGSSLVSDSFEEPIVLEFKTPEIITDQSSAREIIEVKHSLEQPMLSSLKDEVAAKEEQNEHFNVFEGRCAQHSEEVVNTVKDETQYVYQNQYCPQSQILHPAEDETMNIQSKDDVSEHTDDDENPETKTTSSTAEEKNEEFSDGGKHNTSVPSSVFSESEKGFQVAASDESIEDTLKGPNESDTPGSEEVRGHHRSVDAVKNKLKEEVKPTQTEEITPMLNIPETMLEDAQDTDHSEMFSEPPTDQTDIINTHQPGMILNSDVDSATNKEDSNSDENHVDLGHVDKSESPDCSSCIDEQTETGFGPNGNRTVLESSCRNEGRQQIKHTEVELSDNADCGETSETIAMPFTTETKKEQCVLRECDTILSVSHDIPVSSIYTIGYPSEVHTEMESVIPKCGNILEDQYMTETGFQMEASDTKLDGLDFSDPLESEEVKDAHLSEDDEKKESQDIPAQDPTVRHPTSYQGLHEATDLNDSEIIHGNPADQIEIPKPHQSELSVKNTHDPANTQQNIICDRDPVQENPTTERHLTLESRSECDFVDDSKQPWINYTEIGDIALGVDDKDQFDDDVKHSDETSVDVFDLQERHFSPSVNEQTETGFDPRGNRRKLGSSRRIKGRQQVKKSSADGAENTEEADAPEMILSLTPESKKDLGQQSEPHNILSASNSTSVISTFTPDHSSGILNTPLTDYIETDLESLIPHGQHAQGARDDSFTEGVVKGLFDKSEYTTMEECDKSFTLGTEEDRDSRHAEEDGKKPTQIGKIKQIQNTFETMLDDADDNPEIISGNLREAEIKSTNQFEAMANCSSDSATQQKHPVPDDPQVEHYTRESNIEPSDQKYDNDHLHHAKKPQISDVEGRRMSPECVDVLKGNAEEIFHREKEELFSEIDEQESFLDKVFPKTPFDTQPQENVTTELLQTKSLITSVETIMEGIDKSDPLQAEKEYADTLVSTSELTAVDLFAKLSEDKWVIDQPQCSQMQSNDEHSSIVSVTDEGMDKSTQLLTQEGIVQNYSLNEPYVGLMTVISPEKSSQEEQTEPEQSVDAEVDTSVPVQKQEVAPVFCESLINQIYPRDVHQPEQDIKSTEDLPAMVKFSDLDNQQVLSEQNRLEAMNQNAHDTKKKEVDDNEGVHTTQGDMLTCAEKTTDQDNKGHFSPLQQNNTDPSSSVNQEILGSSQDESTVTSLEETDKPKTEDANLDAEQMTNFSSEAPLSECTKLTIDQQLIKSDSRETRDDGLPTLYSMSENKETDEDTQQLKLAEHFPGSYSFMDVDSECRKSPMTTEIPSDKNNPRTHEVHCSVEQETFLLPKEEMTKNKEPKEDFNSSELREAQQSDDVDNKLEKGHNDATVMHQSSYSSALEDKPLLQTLETYIHLDSQLQDTHQSIDDEIHTGIKPGKSKRRLGSSRRFKGSQQVKEDTSEPHVETEADHVESTKGDEPLKMTKISLTTQTIIQGESDDLKLAEDVRKNGSTECEDTKKLSGELMLLTENVLNDRTSITTDFISNSDNGAFLESNVDKTLVEELWNVRGLTGSDADHMNLIQTAQRGESDTPNISSHDDNASFTLAFEDVVDQIEVSQIQNTEALSCDNDSLEHEFYLQKQYDVKETENSGEAAESSMDVQGLEEYEVGRKCEDPTDEVTPAQGIYTSPQRVSAAQAPAVDLPFDKRLSPAMDASNNSESERSQSGYCEVLQVKSTQKKRKMGSTRRSQLNRKQEEEKVQEGTTYTDSVVGNLVKIEAVEQLQICAEVSQNENASPASSTTYKEAQEDKTLSAHGKEHEQRGSSPDVQSTDSNVIPDINDLLDLFPQQSATHNVSIVSPVNDADVKDGETEINVTVQPPEIHNFTSTEIQMTSERNIQETTNVEVTGEARGSLMLPSETTQVTHSEENPESVRVTQVQKDDQQNTNDEDLESQTFHVKTTTNKRRKMGSTRRNLGFQTKGQELHQEQEEENDATEPETPDRDVTEQQELQLPSDDKGHHSTDKEEKVFETVERTHINESQLKPPAPQSPPAETEHQLFVSGVSPSTSAAMSELASGGRRRKMGSHRKSRGHQNQEDQTQDERQVGSITEACEDTATEEQRQEPSSQDEISELDERRKKASASDSDIKARVSLRSVSEETSPRPHHADVTLNQESRTQLSLAGKPRGGGLRSDGYNVVMIGDSGVGKTSFMKRAQSGKFSLTLPASIGVDSCMWTVVVDGKPVVLHVWDTAGQERFRSITRQVFHRAQAFLLMYDVSSPQSFSAISYWANCIQESGAENVFVLLLGNKSDCAERKVQTQQGEVLAQECNFGFMECSAATGENVIQSLESVARMLSQTSDSRREVTMLHKEPEKKKGSRCC